MGYNENPPYFLTAYEIAVKRGFRGTEEEWLESLTCFGQAQVAGYTGTMEDWIATLVDPVPDLQIGEVLTLAGGSMATATITGDKKKPILNLGIPRGVGMADALPIIGGTMRGGINMNSNVLNGIPTPTENSHAVNKEYADQFLAKSGGTMTGHLNVPAPTEKAHPATKEYADQMLPKTGGTMTGALNVLEPTEGSHAVPKSYVDAYVKDQADARYFRRQVVLSAGGWPDAAPYTQKIAVEGILETDCPHWTVVYSADAATAIAEKEAFAVVDELETTDGYVTFTCFEEKPGIALTIQMEVNR